MRIARALNRLQAVAKRLEHPAGLDKAIERLAADLDKVLSKFADVLNRLSADLAADLAAARELSEQILRLIADERAEAEQDRMQDAGVGAELEQIQVENEQHLLAMREAELAATRAAEAAASSLTVFISEHVHEAPGHRIPFAEFYNRFTDWLAREHPAEHWSKIRVTKSLPDKFPAGVGNQNVTYIINAAWEPAPPLMPLYLAGDRRIKRI